MTCDGSKSCAVRDVSSAGLMTTHSPLEMNTSLTLLTGHNDHDGDGRDEYGSRIFCFNY